jgi:hypothetical protein
MMTYDGNGKFEFDEKPCPRFYFPSNNLEEQSISQSTRDEEHEEEEMRN